MPKICTYREHPHPGPSAAPAAVREHAASHDVATLGDAMTLQSTYDTQTAQRGPSFVDGSGAVMLVSRATDGH